MSIIHNSAFQPPLKSGIPEHVAFDRPELSAILTLYGQMVALGEWRDYAISFDQHLAVFAVFRRTADLPLYTIEKRPKLRHRQGMYAAVTADGQILRRGHDLKQVLRVFEKRYMRSI